MAVSRHRTTHIFNRVNEPEEDWQFEINSNEGVDTVSLYAEENLSGRTTIHISRERAIELGNALLEHALNGA